MLANLIRAYLLILLTFAFSCDRKPSDTETDQIIDQAVESDKDKDELAIEYKEGDPPADDAVIATWKDHSITLADFEYAVQLGLLFLGRAPQGDEMRQRLAMPHLQFTMTRSLVGRAVLMEEAEKRNLEPTSEEMIEALGSIEALQPYADLLDDEVALTAKLEPLALTREDLMGLAKEMAIRKLLEEKLLESITMEEAWKQYEREKNQATIAYIKVLNIPTSNEIDTFMEANAAAIETYFEENRQRFRTPPMIRVDAVRATPDTPQEVLDRIVEEVRSGKSLDEVAAEEGWQVHRQLTMHPQESPRAARAEIGEIGWDMPARGPIVWRVLDKILPTPLELDRAIRREIAATLITDQGLVPSIKSLLEETTPLLESLPVEDGVVEPKAWEGARAMAQSLGIHLGVSPPFSGPPNDVISGIGLAPDLVEKIFERDEPGMIEAPILSRQDAFKVRVLTRSKATRAAFEAEADQYLTELVDSLRPVILDQLVEERFRQDIPEFDLAPLQIRHGVIRK